MTRALDLFAGAGGVSLGLDRAGYDVLGVEHWPPACDTARRNGHRTICADVGALPINGTRFDLVWGSPPCQPYSQSGKGEGADDERDATPAWTAAVLRLRPRVAIMENVPAILRFDDVVETIYRDLAAAGYSVAWRVLCCADYGVPQTRRRLFLIARLDGAPRWPEPTHAEHHTPLLPLPRWVSWSEALGLDGWLKSRQTAPTVGRRAARYRDPEEPAFTVRGDGASDTIVRLEHRNNSGTGEGGREIPRHRWPDEPAVTVTHKAMRLCGNQRPGGRADRENQRSETEPSQTITSRGDVFRLHTNRDQREDGSRQQVGGGRPAPTLTTMTNRWKVGADGSLYRGLAPREGGILQGFPPDYRWPRLKTRAWTMIGNAVPPAMAEALARANR